ncbi:MAG: hypothetical protein SPF98_06325 [Campylobacter sp.]|nr:hypothetical protein [Campylobacter sp.]
MYYPSFDIGGSFSIFVVLGVLFYLYPKRFLITLFKILGFISFFALLFFYFLPTLLVVSVLAIVLGFVNAYKMEKLG